MNTDNVYLRRLRRLKWGIFGLAALSIAAIEAYYYFIRGVPLVEDLVDWLIGMGVAVVLIEIIFRAVANLQTRLQREINERTRAEEALRAYSERLEEMVEERTQELREAQERLIRQEKLAVLGQMAGSVGHELRNPLGVLSNAAYFLKITLSEADETSREYLDIISSEVHKADRIVSDLLNFARTRLAAREAVPVSTLIAQVLAEHPPPEGVAVSTQIPSDLPPVFVDPQQIGQVLANLVTNAYQAMPEGGQLSVSSEQSSVIGDQSPIPEGHDVSGLQYPKGTMSLTSVSISVTDTGCGISPENMKKLFEPLFTTKARGIGLGLAISKNLVESNRGSIEVVSDGLPGKGSTFTVHLPLREGD